ncbi:N-alpha-acetyltransferase 35 NatC auxiliary subunit [Boothiomyces sp. JEL0866]|nr:N-alpha-acetyltransferase 35 NatC auxiliary subunit [Boothiomyces sp. JEL0866]
MEGLELKELEALKMKLGHIIESLNLMPDLLLQFNSTIAKYESLITDLQSSKYQQTIVLPHLLMKEDPEFFPRVLLRSKLVPDVTDMHDDVLYTHIDPKDRDYQKDDPAIKQAVKSWESKVDDRHSIITQLLEVLDDIKEELEPFFKPKAVKKTVQSNGKELEKLLQWMSSGPVLMFGALPVELYYEIIKHLTFQEYQKVRQVNKRLYHIKTKPILTFSTYKKSIRQNRLCADFIDLDLTFLSNDQLEYLIEEQLFAQVIKCVLQKRLLISKKNLELAMENAANYGCYELVVLLCKYICPSFNENMVFRFAAKSGHTNIVSFLLRDSRVDPTCLNQFPIRIAAQNGHLETVKLLLHDSRIDPTAKEDYAIRYAAYNGHFKIVQELLTNPNVNPASLDNSCIQIATLNGHLDVVHLLLKDARVNPAMNNNSVFRLACLNGHTELVKLLLQDDRIDPAADDNYSIYIASRNGHIEILQILLKDPRVNPSASDNIAICAASQFARPEILKILLNDPRVNPSAKNNFSLFIACKGGHLEIVQILLKDIRIDPSFDENAALRVSCQFGHFDIVETLLQDPRVDPSDKDDMACRLAYDNQHMKIYKLLQSDRRVKFGKKLALGELVVSEKFSYFSGMTAIPLMDPIMDTGMSYVPDKWTLDDAAKELSLSQLLGLIDALFVSLLDHLQEKNRYAEYLLQIILAEAVLAREIINNSQIFFDEDFFPDLQGLDFESAEYDVLAGIFEDLKTGLLKLDSNEDQTKQLLIGRIEFHLQFIQILQTEEIDEKVFESFYKFNFNDGADMQYAFDYKINRFFMLTQIDDVLPELNAFGMKYPKASALPRCFLYNLVTRDMKLYGKYPFISLIKQLLIPYRGVSGLSLDELQIDKIELALTKAYCQCIKILCFNRPRTRRQIVHLVSNLDNLHEQVFRNDYFNLELDYFASFVNDLKLDLMIKWLEIGFEIELYSLHEYPMIFCYMHFLHSLLGSAEKIVGTLFKFSCYLVKVGAIDKVCNQILYTNRFKWMGYLVHPPVLPYDHFEKTFSDFMKSDEQVLYITALQSLNECKDYYLKKKNLGMVRVCIANLVVLEKKTFQTVEFEYHPVYPTFK